VANVGGEQRAGLLTTVPFRFLTPGVDRSSWDTGEAEEIGWAAPEVAMFVQVIQGRVTYTGGLRAALERSMERLGADADASGWLGTTAGVTDDGILITLACFDTAEHARREIARPGPDQWRAEISKHLADPVTVDDSRDVTTQLGGGPVDAGFVQIMRGRFSDVERTIGVLEEMTSWEVDFRPDIVGGLLAIHGDGVFTEAVYFRTEAAARAGERAVPPAEPAAALDVLVQDVTYFDLREPWLFSPQ